MSDWGLALLLTSLGIAAICLVSFAFLGWLVSVWRRDTSIVDSMWSVYFLIAGWVYLDIAYPDGGFYPVYWLLLFWSLRLGGYITWRNWGEGEDKRYQAIRANNEPGYWWKSLYIVFGFQALLALIISLPLFFSFSAFASGSSGSVTDYLGITLLIVGLFFEAVGDFQLARFKADPANSGKVMDQGLWAYTRHPNYFGNFCIWWGFYTLGLSSGGWWTIFSPIIMSFLLLKVSGVALLEKDIGKRRPKYADYIKRVNAFFPGPQKK